jgi:putative lipase involved disintegration of autophagic bodies
MSATKKGTINVATLAQLAADVYHVNGHDCDNWRPLNSYGVNCNQGSQVGFYARVYYSPSLQEVVISFRGTGGVSGRENSFSGKVNDVLDFANDMNTNINQWAPDILKNVFPGITILSGLVNTQSKMADEFVQRVKDNIAPYKLIGLVGHSLGGGLAAICALKHETPCCTFNPAPIDSWLNSAGRNFYGDKKTYQYVTNIISENDYFVSSLNNIGSRLLFSMPVEHSVPGFTTKVDKKTGHSIDKLATALKNHPLGLRMPFL